MRLAQISIRNLRQRLLTSSLTTLSIVLGTALVAFLWLVSEQAKQRYESSSRGINVILGPKDGSPLDLVLSTIYMIEPAQGVLPLSVYREFRPSKKNRRWGRFVRCAVPVAFGDSYRGFPIVATTDEWFNVLGKPKPAWKENRPLELRFAAGRPFEFSHEDLLAEAKFQAHRKDVEEHAEHVHHDGGEVPQKWKKVVIGASVAAQLGIGIGAKIVPAHGVGNTIHDHSEAESEVVGVLEPVGTPIDRAIYIPLGAFYRFKDHEAIGSEKSATSHGDVEISAVVLNTRPPIGFQHVRRAFQRRSDAQAALPAVEIRKLFALIGNITMALQAVSWIVLVVAAIGVFLSLYNIMNERRRDVAIMRSLGARKAQIFSIFVLEALLIAGVGAVLGVLLAHGLAAVLGPWLLAATGVPVTGATFGLAEVWLILGVAALGAYAGLLPAAKAARTDVARFLSPDR